MDKTDSIFASLTRLIHRYLIIVKCQLRFLTLTSHELAIATVLHRKRVGFENFYILSHNFLLKGFLTQEKIFIAQLL